ncbi:MAG: FecR domain-containing protein [Luteimonas sp.]
MRARTGAAEPEALPDDVVEAAIAWYVRLSSGLEDDGDRQAFRQWRKADRRHALAWERMASLGERFVGKRAAAPAPLAIEVLDAAGRLQGRRRALKALAWAGLAGGATWLLQGQAPWRRELHGLVADVATRTGEQRHATLPDGSRLRLNTATAVDLDFTDVRRTLVLRRGEIEIDTAPDPRGRPFLVRTRDGTLRPLGTRFHVRREDAASETFLAVVVGAVEVMPSGATLPWTVQAGRQVRFDRLRAGGEEALDERRTAWAEGLITAQRTPLGEFVRELDRYHVGRLRCAPEVAGLELTAVFRLQGDRPADAILASLESTLPVRIERSSRFRTTVAAR